MAKIQKVLLISKTFLFFLDKIYKKELKIKK